MTQHEIADLEVLKNQVSRVNEDIKEIKGDVKLIMSRLETSNSNYLTKAETLTHLDKLDLTVDGLVARNNQQQGTINAHKRIINILAGFSSAIATILVYLLFHYR